MRAESAYSRLIEAAALATVDLDEWSSDAALATPAIVRAITEDDVAFLTRIGGDSVTFAALKGLAPYELRAWAIRAITGLPGPPTLTADPAPAAQDDTSVPAQVLGRIAEAAAQNQRQLGLLFRQLMRSQK